jgi:hypothetical protein
MAFSKTFPKTVEGSNYPQWEEVYLTEEEEKQAEDDCRRENFRILDSCLEEAKMMAIKHGLNTDEIRTKFAIALFEKRASHVVFWKEKMTKEKFDEKCKG